MPVSIIYIASVMLFIGATPLPYAYYMLLRLVATATFAWAAIIVHEKGKVKLMWPCIGLVLLFNPIIVVHLTWGIWALVDVFAGLYLLSIRKQIGKVKQ